MSLLTSTILMTMKYSVKCSKFGSDSNVSFGVICLLSTSADTNKNENVLRDVFVRFQWRSIIHEAESGCLTIRPLASFRAFDLQRILLEEHNISFIPKLIINTDANGNLHLMTHFA